MSLLNKFDNIEIQTKDKISPQDKEFCEKQQFVYDKAYDCFTNVKEQYETLSYEASKTVKDNCVRYVYYLEDISKYIKDMNFSFLCKIYNYFEHAYNLKLDCYKREKQFKTENRFNYHEIVDLIIEEIGGFSFEEATIIQLKEAIRKAVQYHKITVKKETIVFEKLIYWGYEKWDKDYNCYKFEQFMKVCEAIQRFDTKKDINTPKWYTLDTKYFEQLENPMTIDGDMLKQIKLFKNGKVEMKFNSSENALKFAKEWCSYESY